jgi:hypothetical protein
MVAAMTMASWGAVTSTGLSDAEHLSADTWAVGSTVDPPITLVTAGSMAALAFTAAVDSTADAVNES